MYEDNVTDSAWLIADRINELLMTRGRITVGIDGRCAAGKTTLAAELSRITGAAVVHADHFFLRPEQRTDERYSEAGGNLDRERLLEEVLAPISRGERVAYRPFDCRTGTLGEVITLPDSRVVIVEGSYSLHPDLRNYYDLKIFLTVQKDEEAKRIIEREGNERAQSFFNRWIPLEEAYFSALSPKECSDIVLGGER